MKELKVFDFDKVFRFAEVHYGIEWNPCNDIFFGNSLEYGKHTTVYPDAWCEYIDLEMTLKDKASDYTREEVSDMDDCTKSYVILSAYLESIGITDDEVLVDCT